MKSFLLSGVLLTALMGAAAPAAADESGVSYQITKTVSLGAPDRWDYVVFDAPSHRVYVAHGDRVTVVDGLDGSIIGQIEGFPGGTHGIAVVPALGRGFTDDGHAGEAGAFDLKTLKTSKRIKTAEDADGMVFEPVSGHVFVVNGDTGTVTVIDPKQEKAVAEKPRSPATMASFM
jgi:DNA-binding beta-propeller fold protein YncE